MNKIVIVIGIIAIALIGWLLFSSESVNYIAEVNNEVTALEAELAEIEAAVQAGVLTPEDAAVAQTRIVARIDAVSTMTTAGQRVKYTDAQRAQLVEGLERLKQILIKYQSTLTVIDSTVLELPEAERPILHRRGGGSGKALATIAAETIAAVEDQIEDIIEEVANEELAEKLADSMSEPYTPEDEMGTSTEETTSEEASLTDNENDTEAEASDASTEEMSEDMGESIENDSQMEDDTIEN